ncbi:hypothetical protein QC762_0095120 [Podospora pseudocomata]|uniref:Uncharacterized protein n=1 Tax=Podospora pseudocomata TaxID=2093779 RepID=A0ABR0G7E2_9PEZI|nr:hypothetical protein QC762_0095120 [Podospora pseudocomata]
MTSVSVMRMMTSDTSRGFDVFVLRLMPIRCCPPTGGGLLVTMHFTIPALYFQSGYPGSAS